MSLTCTVCSRPFFWLTMSNVSPMRFAPVRVVIVVDEDGEPGSLAANAAVAVHEAFYGCSTHPR